MIIDKLQIETDVMKALQEDIGTGDVTANLLPENLMIHAEIISREPMLVCGIPWVEAVFKYLYPETRFMWKVEEKQWLPKASLLCEIEGDARSILTAERTALNFMQMLSGTATQTYRCVQQLSHSKTRLLDTRKTLPGLRFAQKYAVFCGGGVNHRMGLYDAFLIKENHIQACGSITKAIQLAKKNTGTLFIEVEVETMEELKEAQQASPDRILLDNFTLEMIREAVILNKSYSCTLEASGGIGFSDLKAVADTGVDFISMGELTKSLQAIDLSLGIRNYS